MFRKVINSAVKVSNAVENISNGLSEIGNAIKKVGNDAQKKDNEFTVYTEMLKKAEISAKFVANIKIVFENSGREQIFGQADIMVWLECSKSKATNIMNAMKKAEIVVKVKGFGAGKYRFIEK